MIRDEPSIIYLAVRKAVARGRGAHLPVDRAAERVRAGVVGGVAVDADKLLIESNFEMRCCRAGSVEVLTHTSRGGDDRL